MEIRIGKSARDCSVCAREFIHDEHFNSVANVVDGVLLRKDYCETCWEASVAAGVYSAWSPIFYDPKVAEQEPPEVFSPLRQLFYEAVESDDRLESARAFLAAQLLRRQKVFRRIKESDGGDSEVRIVLYADRIGNRMIEVRDPNFSYSELEAARGALMDRLQEIEAPAREEENGEYADTQRAQVAREA